MSEDSEGREALRTAGQEAGGTTFGGQFRGLLALAELGGPVAEGRGVEGLARGFRGGELNGEIADGGAFRVAGGYR